LAAAAPRALFGQAPAVLAPKSVKPVVISSANGNVFKNGGSQTCVEKAFHLITQGSDVLDALVAKAVLEQTDHHLLVGQGAQDFARNLGFTIEDDLNTEKSRRLWLEWKRRTDPGHYLDPQHRAEAGLRAASRWPARGSSRRSTSRAPSTATASAPRERSAA
jgi:hypothetical protein